MSQSIGETDSAPLAGRVTLVTRSGRGLGRVIAGHLAGLGADLVIHDRSNTAPSQYGEAATLAEVAQRLEGRGRVLTVACDVTDEVAIQHMVDEVQSTRGPISILVNCAGGDVGAKGTARATRCHCILA